MTALDPSADPRGRGVAMLIVLATLVVAVTACATLARISATASVARRSEANLRSARELARAADGPILRWLKSESAGVVLPPEARLPEIPVLAESWQSGHEGVAVRVTGYDQCGMLGHARLSSPLRQAVPERVAAAADELVSPGRSREALGLDIAAASAERHGVALFPAPAADSGIDSDETRARPAEAVGGWVATHSPGTVLNINTAPMPLVEAALREGGRGGGEVIRKARAGGQPAGPPARTGRRQGSLAPVLVGSSGVWSFRVDARVGLAEYSTWSVYTSDSGEWRCVQRLVIDR